jgi:hypothetical protein
MAEEVKKKMKKELVNTEIEKTNDVDKYCDCIIKSIQTDFTVKEFMQADFNETQKYQNLVDKCLAATIKEK